MNDQTYFELTYNGTWQEDYSDYLIKECGAQGIQELNLEEFEVDELLGEESFCGGNLPLNLSDKIEESALNSSRIIFCYDKESKNKVINFFKNMNNTNSINVEIKAVEDWNSEWKKYYKTIELSEGSIRIIPEWENVDAKSGVIDVKISPAQGFGTGTHETTQLCLELAKIIDKKKYKSVFDFGCGSGILGIAAQKINKNIDCDYCDIDENALDNTRYNLELNQLAARKVFNISERENNIYDLVFANILKPVLLSERNYLTNSTKIYLILSGLLNEQVEGILSAYSKDFDLVEKVNRNDWSAILLKKK